MEMKKETDSKVSVSNGAITRIRQKISGKSIAKLVRGSEAR